MCDGDLGQVTHTECATVIWDRKDGRNSRRRNEKGRVVFDRTGMGTKKEAVSPAMELTAIFFEVIGLESVTDTKSYA